MFPEDSREPYERTRKILEKLAPTLRRLPNRIQITGHTSAQKPGTRPTWTSWDLSVGRAAAVREILATNGLSDDRFAAVVGKADTDPTFPGQSLSAGQPPRADHAPEGSAAAAVRQKVLR